MPSTLLGRPLKKASSPVVEQPSSRYEGLRAVKARGDEAVGANIIGRALAEPLRQIASNAGWEGSVVVERVKTGRRH